MIAMDAGARGWTVKTARRNYWRVARWYDLDDLIQDGFMQYYRIAGKYSHVTERRHLMAIFKLTYMSWITDLANKRTREPEEITSCVLMPGAADDTPLWDKLVTGEPEQASLRLVLAEAPAPVRAVLSILATEEGRARLRSPYRIRRVGRETLNERLCRIAGYDPTTINLVSWVRNYLIAS